MLYGVFISAGVFFSPVRPIKQRCCTAEQTSNSDKHSMSWQVKKLGDNSDIVYLSYQGKLGVCARDLCLLRAWQQRPDGSTILVSRSIDTGDVPRVAGKVRAECHDCAYMVSPADDGCIFSYVIQLDMKGYVPLFFSNLIQTQHPLIISMLRRHLEDAAGQN